MALCVLIRDVFNLQVVQTILDCSVEVATKCGIYATLVGKFNWVLHTGHLSDHFLLHHNDSVTECKTPRFTTAGLWHADEESIVNMLLDKACEGLNQALATGDRYRARLLLRLLAGLTTANVVSMPSMFATLNHIVSTAVQVLQGALDAGMLQPGRQVHRTEYRQQAQSSNTCTLCDACFGC